MEGEASQQGVKIVGAWAYLPTGERIPLKEWHALIAQAVKQRGRKPGKVTKTNVEQYFADTQVMQNLKMAKEVAKDEPEANWKPIKGIAAARIERSLEALRLYRRARQRMLNRVRHRADHVDTGSVSERMQKHREAQALTAGHLEIQVETLNRVEAAILRGRCDPRMLVPDDAPNAITYYQTNWKEWREK